MFLVIRKKACFCVLLLLFLAGIFLQREVLQPSDSVLAPVSKGKIVILDPGHGGEDGGAVSPDGIAESGINLEIALSARDVLTFCGQPVLLTRSKDIALDHGEGTMRKRKASDLRSRVILVNEETDPILISIHQNSLPSSPVTHGAYVFWNPIQPAQEVAETIQSVLNQTVNRENEKRAREIPTSVYLMKHITAPGVLIECGFLSNKEEAAKLQEASYQCKLATILAAGWLQS